MTSLSRRRTSLLLAVVLGAAVTALAPPVAAEPVPTPYTCSSPDFNENQKLDIDISLETTAPATVYVGRSVTPTLVVRATIPGNIVGIAALFGIRSASATGTFTVKVNGTPTDRPLVFPRTDIPQSASDFAVTIPIALPALTRGAVGTVAYTPGPIALSLTGYNKSTAQAQPGDDVGTIAASCSPQNPDQVFDTVRFVRSASTTSSSVAYAKSAKKVTTSAKVVARSGVVPTGSVRVALFKGAKRVAAKTVPLAGGRATTAFAPVRAKGSYRLVTTYAGNAAVTGSTVSRSFTIR